MFHLTIQVFKPMSLYFDRRVKYLINVFQQQLGFLLLIKLLDTAKQWNMQSVWH